MVGRLSPMCTNTIGLQQMGHGEKTRHPGKKMSQLEELKSFVSERLNAVATEIVGAIEKTITDYEEQAFRLREENERHRSLLDIILRTKLPPQPEACQKGKITFAAGSPSASDLSHTHKATKTFNHPSELQFVFNSRTDFLKFATRTANGNCPYCIKAVEATEAHLIKRHYLMAVHFIDDGTENFVVPCVCKDKIQVSGRSHWHCPLCRKIIFRRTNFEQHLSKQHGIAILQECQRAEIDQQPSFEEIPVSPETWCEQELGSLGHKEQQTTLLIQIKGEEEQEQEIWKQDSHPEFQNLEQLQIKDDQIKNDISEIGQQSLASNSAHYSVSSICVGTYSEYPIKINRLENSKGCTFSNSLTEPLDAQPDIGTCGISPLAEEHQHTTEDKTEWKKHALSRLRAFCSKKKRFVKRSFPPLTSNTKTSTRSPASQNPSGPHCCKACGKTFHYMHTLRKHAQAHAADQIHICGICGQHLESKENLVQHLQSHRKRNKCAVCGKEFSSNARLTRHRRFHRPKGLIVPSSS